MRALKIQLFNLQVLACKEGDLRDDKLADVLDLASTHDVDIILCTELGTTAWSQPLVNLPYLSDWTIGPKVRPGSGVGAFYKRDLQAAWTLLETESAPEQSRFYIFSSGFDQLLIGVFYAPDSGKPMAHRWSFYRKLQHPKAQRILAGDANLPGSAVFSARNNSWIQ